MQNLVTIAPANSLITETKAIIPTTLKISIIASLQANSIVMDVHFTQLYQL